jgi:two-component system, OmpR family, response regulator
MRVLLIEDDLNTGQSLFASLKNADYSVDWVRDGSSGRSAIKTAGYAVVLLALGLHSMGGLELLRALRACGNTVPVLMLAAQGDPEKHAQSLDAGADDCVLKPVDFRGLTARMRAVLRRRAGSATSLIGNESLGLDLEKRVLSCNGVASSLSAREFALMHAFMERPGAILSRCQLEERIYGWGREVESNAVDVLIHMIRKRFGRSLIRNVRGLGWSVMGDSSRMDQVPVTS